MTDEVLSKPTQTPREGTRPTRLRPKTSICRPAALSGRGFERTSDERLFRKPPALALRAACGHVFEPGFGASYRRTRGSGGTAAKTWRREQYGRRARRTGGASVAVGSMQFATFMVNRAARCANGGGVASENNGATPARAGGQLRAGPIHLCSGRAVYFPKLPSSGRWGFRVGCLGFRLGLVNGGGGSVGGWSGSIRIPAL